MEVLLMIMMISEFSNIWDIHFFLPSFYRFQGYKIRGLIRSEKRSAPFSVGLPRKAHVYVYPWGSVQADMAIFSTKLSKQKTIFCSSQGISNTENTRDHDAELATK